jgi:hypothetical protein
MVNVSNGKAIRQLTSANSIGAPKEGAWTQSRRPVIRTRHSQNGGQFELDIPEAPHIGTGVVLRCLTIHNPSALTR